MKVAMVSPYALDRHGGVQAQAILLVERLQAVGHEAWLVAPGKTGGGAGTVYLGGTVNIRGNKSVVPIRLAPGTKKAVAEGVAGADVVHIHEPFQPAVSLGALALSDLPKVGTFHADPGRGVRAVYRLAGRRLAKLASNMNAAVAVSPAAAAAVAPMLGRVDLIPNAIDLRRYEPQSRKESLRVAFLGRDEPRKGLDVLLEAWPEVHGRVPGAELVVMGARRPNLPAVRFLGPVGDEIKRAELAKADVFVAPNTGGESFGLVLLEAMASGCALVASGLDPFRHVAGEAATFAMPGDGPGLARALTTMLSDADARRQYQQRALHRVRRFDVDEVVNAYLKVYADAVDSPRG